MPEIFFWKTKAVEFQHEFTPQILILAPGEAAATSLGARIAGASPKLSYVMRCRNEFENLGRHFMINARKFLTAGLVAATFAASIAAETPALARGRGGGGGFGHGGFGHGGFGHAGFGHAGWGHAGWGHGGWGRRGWGYAGYGGGWGYYDGGWGYDDWGYPGWGYDGYDYGVAGAVLGAAALGAVAAAAAQQNQYYYGYPRTQYYRSGAPVSRKGRTCIRYQWDAMQGYVQVRAPC